MLESKLRRGVDIGVGLAGCLLVAFATAAVGLTLRRGVFFRQERLGLHGRPFIAVKFCTMIPDATLPYDRRYDSFYERTTPFSRFLRSTGLDELPQFWNILKGDMSLFGPRPVSTEGNREFRNTLGSQWDARHQIKPGLIPSTLYKAKINNVGYGDPGVRLADDLAYIEKRKKGGAFREDLRLLWGTLYVCITRRIDPQAKMPSLRTSTPDMRLGQG
jgi:lipopolysaccharide/colanic/teichoic acid biosynthesis glycosyltransferase